MQKRSDSKLVKLNGLRVGIDLIEIERFKEIPFHTHESFYRKNFSNNEIDYCLKFNEPYQHFAGKFEIKEATKKALEIKLEMSQIRTEYQKSKPIISIPSKNYDFDVSVSHDGNYAVAIVIAKNKNL